MAQSQQQNESGSGVLNLYKELLDRHHQQQKKSMESVLKKLQAEKEDEKK